MGKVSLDNFTLSDNFYTEGFHSKISVFHGCVNMTL